MGLYSFITGVFSYLFRDQSAPRRNNEHHPRGVSSQHEVIDNFRRLSVHDDVYQQYTTKNVRHLGEGGLVARKKHVTFDVNYFPSCSRVTSIGRSLINISQNNYSHIIPQRTLTSYECIRINEFSDRFIEIKKMITNRFIIVLAIEEIYNPYLKTSYQLKKKQKEKEYPKLRELKLFHGTNLENVNSICVNNLNWRYYGSETGNLFGQGISFSCNAMYAATYSTDIGEKVMFLSDVLVGESCLGTRNMKLPPDGYDSTLKNLSDHIVVVKFEDNEFYPKYKIKFIIHPDYTPKKKKQNPNLRRSRLN